MFELKDQFAECGKLQSVNEIDVIEQSLADFSYPILCILLFDRTTERNIIWASDDYASMGELYEAKKHITPDLITGDNTMLIQPRTAKTQNNQLNRTRDKAEVFTPSWICNAQNNLVDEAWFGCKNVFNVPDGNSWTTSAYSIIFPAVKDRTWQKYVDANRMEISCGEAPYLVSRYDASTGEKIGLHSRIGLLDRKMRIVNENTNDETEWMKWTKRAFQSVYAFEFQGDNLLLARENLLYTFIDNIRFKLNREPTINELSAIATIISWNVWQMDGMTYTLPYGKEIETTNQTSLFDDSDIEDYTEEQKILSRPCKIKDWRSKVILEYRTLVKGARQ